MSFQASLYVLVVLFFSFEILAQNTLVIQPSPTCAKEAMVWRLDTQQGPFGTTNDNNYSSITFWPVMNWTWNGSPGERYMLFDFLDGIVFPEDVMITSARLSLFAPDEPTSDQFHSLEVNTGKPSIGVIQGITEAWDANTLTWNNQPGTTSEEEVVLAAPSTEQEDYLDIDITTLIQRQVQQPGERHGLLMRMRETDFYRKLIFAGSRADDPALRPMLVIDYNGTAAHNATLPLDLLYTEYHQICPGESYTILPIDNSLITSYNWSTGETTPSITVQDTGAYSLIATLGDCIQVMDTIMISWRNNCFEPVSCDVFYPNIFSPNQDGVNDEFRLFYPSDCVLSNYRMEVYNRWGQQVFLSEHPAQGWRGEFKGKSVPGGVYIYQVLYQLPGSSERIQHSGQVTLVR
ncbi:DNRLRE domain-containing protein [Lewinella sp. LCG006]|uniref:DNRLRE domain-containing protein n=1 Tax=Lewinella sp. LCG006 TaxID=3231911 RepID=UPI003460A302